MAIRPSAVRSPILRAAFAGVIALLALLGPVAAIAQAQQRSGQPNERPRFDHEAVLYAQPRMIDEVMAGILPSDKQTASTYFVGFAGWAEQDVFIREVAQARDIVDERLGTHNRSLLLVNHVMALEEVPLASVTNLGLVLGRLGRIMNIEKDSLILFLTSHGVENLLGVRFPSFPLNHLTPPRLREILDRSGIRNRIVIISACHSGSFIPALRHPTTLVMTAARADRASFGCESKNDWTFFGNALFNHGLRATTSLIDAFSAAKKLIAGWEAKERFMPSEPQIFIGDGIRPVLDDLARLPASAASARSKPCEASPSAAEQQAPVLPCND